MAEKNEIATVEEEKVSKVDYDNLVAEYNRISRAFDKAINIIANNYADRIVKDILDAVEKDLAK